MDSDVVLSPTLRQKLPEQWEWRRLDHVCEGIFDCPHSTPLLIDSGPYVARSQDIRTGIFRVKQSAHVSEEIYKERIARAEPKYGDLLFSREGTYFGIAAEIPLNVRVCLGQRMVLLRPDASCLNFRFLRYWLNSSLMADHMHGFRDGTVAERLNMPTIRGLPVIVPPLTVQQEIASTLGALDDKIELNRQMNAPLEAMAQALFKSWFVDFDPVKAKAAGCAPEGMDADTAALFPSEFQDSELGPIPKGWQLKKVSDVADVIKGKSYSSNELAPSSTALVTLKSFNRGGGFRRDGFKAFTGRYKDKQVVKPGELVVSYTDVTQQAEVIGKPAIVSSSPEFNTLVASLDLGIVRPKSSSMPVPFLYFLFLTPGFQDHIYGHTSGTTVLHLSKTGVPNYEFPCPTDEVLQVFEKIASPIFLNIEINELQADKLAEIRNALLPKLISGQLRIPEAEGMVATAL